MTLLSLRVIATHRRLCFLSAQMPQLRNFLRNFLRDELCRKLRTQLRIKVCMSL